MKIGNENKEKARAWKQAQRATPPVAAPGTPSGRGEESLLKALVPKHLATFALLGYGALAAAYWTYGLAYERGLVGYLMYLEMSWTGSISPKLTAFVAMVVLILPALPLVAWPFGLSDMAGPFTPSPDRPWRPLFGWKVIVGSGISVLLATALVCLVLIQVDRADQKRTALEIDLDRSAESPADGAKFAQVRGVLRPDLQFHLTRRGTHYTYTPLVGNDWRPGQPVKYVRYRHWIGSDTSPKQLPVFVPRGSGEANKPSPPAFPVRLSRAALPTYIERSFSTKGVALASPYYVAETVTITSNGSVPSRVDDIVTYGIFIGGGLALLVALALVAVYIAERRKIAAAMRSAARVSVTAGQIARQEVIQVRLRKGESAPIRLPSDAKQGDVFRAGRGDLTSSTAIIVCLDVVGAEGREPLPRA